MSKKITTLSIILLIFGGIMIPGGPMINNLIRDMTYGSIDEGLLGIKEQGIPLVKESVEDMGLKSVAISLALIKEMGADAAELLTNATIWMGFINTQDLKADITVTPIPLYWDMVSGEDYGLGSLTFSGIMDLMNLPVIKGPSEWCGTMLNFSTYNTISGDSFSGNITGLNNLRYGVNTTEMWWGKRLPGIFEDTYRRLGDTEWPPHNLTDTISLWDLAESVAKVDMDQDRGLGIIELIKLIESANETEIEEMCGPKGYNFTYPEQKIEYRGQNYTKLEILYYYLTDYFFKEGVNKIIDDFNINGMISYIYPQYRPRDWNGHQTSYRDVSIYSIIEQWAKCISYDEGADLHDSEPSIPEGTYGLEPAGPDISSGIPMQAALQLWNQSNELSFTNIEGIYKWYEANFSSTVYQELLDEFSQYTGYEESWIYLSEIQHWSENDTYGEVGWGFNETDMDLVLDWLWGNGGGWNHGSFYEMVFPKLITDPACFRILLEQWAYGSIVGNLLYPDGFPLPLGSVTVKGFEIGYQGLGQPVIPTNMSIKTALTLWEETNAYSLVSAQGLQSWFAAVGGDTLAKAILMAANGLSEGDMNLLLEWIPNFQHNVMPYLAQYQYSLPADSISLGKIIQIGAIGIGIAFVGLGAFGIAGTIRSRRKRLNPFKIGS